VQRHLSGVGPGNQIGGGEKIGELLVAQPAAAADKVFVKQRDMPGRAAECGGAEQEKRRRDRR
jgi:hypothetical protein